MEVFDLMDFSEALKLVKLGKYVSRTGWNGPNQYIGIQYPDENSVNLRSYLWIMPVDKKRVPWVASHSDLLANDWYEVV